MDKPKIEELAKQLIEAIGEDSTREGLKDTPRRMAKSFEKLFEGYAMNPKNFLTEFDGEDYDEMIICKNIDLYSTCEHHMLPFIGKAHIGYIPNKKIIGLSKLPRIVETFSRRLQNQERLTMQIANTLKELLQPKGVGIVIEANHLCMRARGVEKQNASMTTSSFKGLFKENSKTRSEFLKLIG
ncbi:GTP cyclohydrolase I FolE [Candidatus Peregrinibacteria bacterium]|jgi:GTP cyclohydrolase IA|nr:GTP cyclohydrolase I FolE [Candidatus Peregrinibacteria bacterium]MBT7736116.1 GTP cyclohydrolase I FolE [Candidatus Peregrinibacteria bacterium]